MRIKLLLALLVLALPLQAQFAITNPATVYVSMSGNNANAMRGRADRPWRSPSNGVWAVQNGDRAFITGNHTNELHYTNVIGHAINVLNKTNVTFYFAGSFMYGFGAGSHILVSNCSNLKFFDLSIVGNKPAASVGAWILESRGAFMAVDVRQSSDITFERIYLKNHPNHGILCGDDTTVGQNIRIHSYNGYFENIGATNGVPGATPADGAVFVPEGSYCDFVGNVVTNCARGVELYSNVSDTKGWRISDNQFLHMNWQAIINVSTFAIRDSYVDDNTITGNPNAGLLVSGITLSHHSERNSICRNKVSGMTGYGITMESTVTRPIRFNVVSFNAVTNCSTALRLFPTGTLHSTNYAHNIIEGNTLDSGNIGIDGGGMFNIYANNHITRFATGFRMYHDGANGETNVLNTIMGNMFRHNTTCISLTSSTVRTNRIINNTFFSYTTAIDNNGTSTFTNLNHH